MTWIIFLAGALCGWVAAILGRSALDALADRAERDELDERQRYARWPMDWPK